MRRAFVQMYGLPPQGLRRASNKWIILASTFWLVAHRDKTIAELNDAITAQWRKIDALERQVAKLHVEIQNIGTPHDPSEPPTT